MRCIAAITLVESPRATGTFTARSPCATACATAAATAGSPPTADHTVRRAHSPSPTSSTVATPNTIQRAQVDSRRAASKFSVAASANVVDAFTVSSTPARCSRYCASAVRLLKGWRRPMIAG